MTKLAIPGIYGSELTGTILAPEGPQTPFTQEPPAHPAGTDSRSGNPVPPSRPSKSVPPGSGRSASPGDRGPGISAPVLRRLGSIVLRAAWGWPFPFILLSIWWLASARGWVPDQILPPPPQVYRNLADLIASGDLALHMKISAWRLFWGFVAGTGFGLPLGLVLGLWSPARDYLLPSFKILAQVPILGWIPLLMMLVGIDEALKIIIIAKAVCIPTTLNTCKGMQGVPSLWIEVAKVYRFSRWQLLKKVVAPAAFPQIWAGIRYGLTHGWLALVVVELLASSEGLGFLIVYGRQLFQLDTVLAAVVVVGSVGWSLDKFLSLTESRLLRWRREAF